MVVEVEDAAVPVCEGCKPLCVVCWTVRDQDPSECCVADRLDNRSPVCPAISLSNTLNSSVELDTVAVCGDVGIFSESLLHLMLDGCFFAWSAVDAAFVVAGEVEVFAAFGL